jgi:hypothetical protein
LIYAAGGEEILRGLRCGDQGRQQKQADRDTAKIPTSRK